MYRSSFAPVSDNPDLLRCWFQDYLYCSISLWCLDVPVSLFFFWEEWPDLRTKSYHVWQILFFTYKQFNRYFIDAPLYYPGLTSSKPLTALLLLKTSYPVQFLATCISQIQSASSTPFCCLCKQLSTLQFLAVFILVIRSSPHWFSPNLFPIVAT